MRTDTSCPKCGTPQNNTSSVFSPGKISSKSKTVAVLLAVFLSFWTWLYTYKKSAAKFWVGLGVSLFVSVGVYFGNYIPAGPGFLITIGIQIWAIIDVSVKPSSFYQQFRK